MASGNGGSLLTFLARRLLIAVLLLFLISLGVYSLILIIPGNPAIALAGGTKATPAEIAKITNELHLNEGFFVQYWNWLQGGAARGPRQLALQQRDRGLRHRGPASQ